MGSPYSDLERPPLSSRALNRALVHPGSLWTELRILASTGSTNADVAAARQHSAEGLVIVAEHQESGRGRLDRRWSSPPRAGLTFSMLLRPAPPRATWSWLPLLTGLALRRAVAEIAELDTALKWPNDLLVGERKLAGILTEVHGDAVVVGVGLNVTTRLDELLPTATSLSTSGAEVTDRDTLLRSALRAIESAYVEWTAHNGKGKALRSEYAASCATVGSQVRVTLTDGSVLVGRATGIDEVGQLEVETADGRHTVSSGDVQHVRGT